MTAQTPRPTIVSAPVSVVVKNNRALLLRMPTTPTEERTIGARAIIIFAPNLTDRSGRAAVEEALNTFDNSAEIGRAHV
jgi:hypothetical protein